ncbi:heme biosynthesis HemY N-terminal domain-containing protein [Marivita sp. GX14005]|uniref:heme biosynthesis protein HemY n=1 Tax=Marivita sp. GX14005 TaxID=2942276 RepID=UPI002018C881|nr:heme biosynthesis HemY N-terminal domain-containing protein [Marivita sp. GX14005]MCL3881580.1 tetratricopeptide repeat protein [Marivita sp. GX14005]
MLWSLLKIVLFVVIVAALTYGAVFLMESTGGVQITVAGVEYTLGPLQSVIAALVFLVLAYVFFKLVSLLIATLKFINGDETAISRYFDRNRERKGYQALGEGLTALAAGEGRLAMAKANKAEKYLHKPELTNLITAQAAEMMGDRKKAEDVYKRLVTHDDTRFVGVRGLMKQKLEEGDTTTALKLAERAFAIKPKHEEVQDILLRLQAQTADWSGARKTLNAKLKHGALPRDVYKRRDAVLALSEAKDVLDDGQTIEAQEAAIAANKSSPDLIPAAAMAARSHIAQGRKKYAVRLLKKAWQAQPHPDLAAAFAEIEPSESAEARLKRFRQLTSIRPEHRETRLLLAELNLAAQNFPEARRSLGDLAETEPDTRVLAVVAAIERGEGAPDAIVRGWLARALTAPRGPQWVCENCNTIHSEWTPVCNNCESFDTLSWTTPPQSDTVLPAGAEMLPLIVGSIEDKTEPAIEPDVDSAPADVTGPAADRTEEIATETPASEDAVIDAGVEAEPETEKAK